MGLGLAWPGAAFGGFDGGRGVGRVGVGLAFGMAWCWVQLFWWARGRGLAWSLASAWPGVVFGGLVVGLAA